MIGWFRAQPPRLLGTGFCWLRELLARAGTHWARHRWGTRPNWNRRLKRAPLISVALLAGVLSVESAPTISSVGANSATPSVTVIFSEPVTAATAGDKTNYSLSGGLSVINATVNNPVSVTLTTSAQSTGPGVGPLYTLTVSNVQNLSAVPITPGTRKSFTSDSGTQIVVNTTTDKNTPGIGAASLREAIIGANAGIGADSILLPAGTYNLGIAGAGEDAAATGDLDVTDDLVITGAGASTTIVDAIGLDRVFHVLGGIVVFSNFTIQGGQVAVSGVHGTLGFSGGGVLNQGNLTLALMVVQSNSASTGAGVFNAGTLTVTKSTLDSNDASEAGGGIYNAGTLNLDLVTLSNNQAYGGGGLLAGNTSTVLHSTFSGNQATSVAPVSPGVSYLATDSYTMNFAVGYNAMANNLDHFSGAVVDNSIATLIPAPPPGRSVLRSDWERS